MSSMKAQIFLIWSAAFFFFNNIGDFHEFVCVKHSIYFEDYELILL